MSEVFFDGFGVKIAGPDIETKECCSDGNLSYASLEHAELLHGELGFEEITDEVIAYREQRCEAADNCRFSETGECALKAAGMLDTFPEELL